jgi:hypothetical protein
MTTLVNSELNRFDEKLKIYNGKFFDVIRAEGRLLSEAISITGNVNVNLGLAAGSSTATSTVYSTDQFSKFIKKVVNFNIKNYDDLTSTELDLGFVNKVSSTYSYHDNNKENIIETLKTINVFVDILEAYKYCIEIDDANAPTGYSLELDIVEIQLVNDKTRFYQTTNPYTMLPSGTNRNVGYIRKVANRNVLFLSIQSFDTGMESKNHNYNNFFTKSGSADLSANTNILDATAKTTKTHNTASITATYKYQNYVESTIVGALTGLTLEQRNKTLIVLLLKTLFGLNKTYRKQSVLALYYYYKFVQLYSAFIINVSNVMYNDVKNTSATTPSPCRIDTYNMTTIATNHGISAVEYYVDTVGTASVPVVAGYAITGVAASPVNSSSFTVGSGLVSSITRGSGFQVDPTLTVTQGAAKTQTIKAKASIVPMVLETTTMGNDDNIERLQDVITQINAAIITLLDGLAANNSLDPIDITTTDSSANDQTSVYKNSSKEVVIVVKKQSMRDSINRLKVSYDLENDFVIYDIIFKKIYDIKKIEEDTTTNEDKITINAVFTNDDIIGNTKLFKSHLGDLVNIPASTTAASSYKITHTSTFLQLKSKDMISYKDTYITTKEEISVLDENIGFMTNRVFHQNNMYETHNTKKNFIERQVLAYNIILAIILLILVGINVVKVDKQIVKTVSLSCLGVIILLFVIYFISNMTYIEAFALSSTDDLYALNYVAYTTTYNAGSAPWGSTNNDATYKTNKLTKLRKKITELNTRFISYFEKVIIMLPATDNFDFYKEISEIITNDKENKDYTNKTLGYSRNRNDNNINSLKYELENNKLYLNTILISAIIFVGLYNVYINYLTDDKYLSLMIFVCMIIFIIIISYYYITANRRVKTVFKSIYWGPEFSKRF